MGVNNRLYFVVGKKFNSEIRKFKDMKNSVEVGYDLKIYSRLSDIPNGLEYNCFLVPLHSYYTTGDKVLYLTTVLFEGSVYKLRPRKNIIIGSECKVSKMTLKDLFYNSKPLIEIITDLKESEGIDSQFVGLNINFEEFNRMRFVCLREIRSRIEGKVIVL